MREIRTGYSCPRCKKETGDTNEVVASDRQLRCSKNGEHVWDDQTDFLEERPKIEFKQTVEKAPQSNHTSVTISIPVPLANAILEKFGDKRDATIAGMMSILCEGETLILSSTDLQRINGFLNDAPQSGSHLVGMIYAVKEEAREARENADKAAQDLKAATGFSPTRVVIDLADQMENARLRAEAEGMPVSDFIARALRNGLENNWF